MLTDQRLAQLSSETLPPEANENKLNKQRKEVKETAQELLHTQESHKNTNQKPYYIHKGSVRWGREALTNSYEINNPKVPLNLFCVDCLLLVCIPS